MSIPVTSLPTILDSYLTDLPQNSIVNFKIVGLTLPPHQRTNNTEIANLPLQVLKQIMKECEKRVKSLLSEEILDGLLQIRPVTKELLDNVKFHMNLLTRSHNRFNFTIPLHFLDIKQARKLFPYELEHSSLVSLRRQDDIFYYVQNTSDTDYSLPFWLLISYFASGVSGGTDLVKISFHCSTMSSTDRVKLFTDIKDGILNVCKRVNQLLLLKELYETKTCNPLLVPEEQTSTNTGTNINVGFEVESSQQLVGKRGTFAPGQFSCNKVHCIQFPLHDRVSLSTAITTITTALQLFLVTNRTNLFVYPEENGRIFYLRLHDSQQESQGAVKTILLDVYGLDFPTPQITEQLYQLLKSRLASATLLNISTLLARNPQFKLTSEDLEFIRGPTTVPLKYLFYTLPSFIQTKHYFVYLKQNLLQFLRVMLSTSTSSETESILGASNQEEELRGLKQDSDCIFTYNYLTTSKVASPVSAAIGRGIAIIQIILLVKETNSSEKISDDLLLQTCVNNGNGVQPLENAKPENTDNIERAIVVKVWARESLLNIGTLVNQMSLSINQCLCEYAVETHYFNKTLSTLNIQQDFVTPVKEVFNKAKSLTAPSVQETKISLTLPTWSIDSFLSELYDIIMELNNRLNPVVVFAENSAIPSFVVWNPHNPNKKERDPANMQSLLMNKESYQFVLVGGKLNWNIEKRTNEISSPQVEREKKESELWSVSDNLLYGHSSADDCSPLLYRNCVILVTLQSEGLSVTTYNWNYTKIEQLNAFVNKIKSWVQSRQQLLRNILHQKMGLFHHTVITTNTPASSTPPLRSSISTSLETSKFSLDTIDPLLNNVSPSKKSNYSGESSPSTIPATPTSPASKSNPTLERQSSSSSLIKKKPILGNFDSLLLNSFPSEISQITSFLNIADPLQRHGNQFKLIAYHNSRIQEYRTNTIFNFNLWSKLYQSTGQSHSKPSLTSLQLLIKNSRIMYSFRLPLYLERHVNRTTNEIETVMTPDITLYTVSDSHNWTKQLLDHYLIDYKAYIEHLGFHVVKFFDPNEQTHAISKDASDAPPLEPEIRDYYGIKLVRNGLLIIRISFEEPFITCDLYAYHNLRSKLAPTTAPTTSSTSFKEISKHNKQQIKLFFEEANKTKELLQLKTFIYDFHVKKLHELLNLLLTNDSLDKFDNIVNYPNHVFYHFLESLRTYYPQIPPESKHFLYTSVITVELSVPSPPLEIFQYITDNAARYHLFTLKKYGISPSIVIKLPNDAAPVNDLANYSALLLLLPDLVEEGETTPVGTQLRALLYLFYTQPDNANIEKNNKTDQIATVAAKFATYFQNVVNQVALHYKRDLLWKGLNSSTSDVQITKEQFQTLKTLLTCKLVEQMDPTLSKLVSTTIPWGPVLTHLASSFPKSARTLSVNKEKQLILLNPYTPNVFLHFELTETRHKMQIWSCSRPPLNHKDIHQQTLDENEFISSVINQILYYIWKFGLIPNR